MKKILGILFINLFFFCSVLRSQVTAEAFPMDPQSGSHNYFGVRVTLSQTYTEDVTVTGYIYDMGGGANTNNPFSLTVTAGNLTAETAANFYQTDPTATAVAELGTIGTTYAGVFIVFEVSNNILRFNSLSNANTVLVQLNIDYDEYNDNYDNNFDTTLTTDQLDSIDVVNGFDEFQPFKAFENLFPGYSSKRSEVESTENTWLANNFSGTDPDNIDLTFDDAENTIFNNNYSFKIGNDVYQLTSSGLYINNVYQDEGGNSGIINENKDAIYAIAYINNEYATRISGPMELNGSKIARDNFSDCKTNKKLRSDLLSLPGTNRYVKLKVAIHSIGISNSIKSKIIHFKLNNNGSPKRSRAKMALRVDGIVRSTVCNFIDAVEDNHPPTVGEYSKKRKSLRARVSDFGTIWKTYQGDVVGSFTMPEGFNDSLPLTW